MAARFPVTFAPGGVTVWAETGTTVLEAARQAGVVIPSPCGGRGVCGKCAVRVLEGRVAPPGELEGRGLKLAPSGLRLACLVRIEGPLVVSPIVRTQIPVSSAGHPAGMPEERGLVAAVDLGTTTVSAVVLASDSGREIGRAVVPNLQAPWGADVLSRIGAALAGEADGLRHAAEESIVRALDAACNRAGACLEAVTRLVVAGNSTMAALLVGEDVSGLAHHPFEAPFAQPRSLSEGSGLLRRLAEGCETVVLPPMAAFIGGDFTAGLVAAGLVPPGATAVYVDAGTNAEIGVLSQSGVWVTSVAAGPAFEGAGVSSGGPATKGAVTAVSVSGDHVTLEVKGAGPPLWMAGSGLLSALAELRRVGHVDAAGLLRPRGPLASRFTEIGGVRAVVLGEGPMGPLTLTQTDIRALQTAKAAVAAGVRTLVRRSGVTLRSIKDWVLAGAFGGAVDPDAELVGLGVLPKEAAGRTRKVPDAALVGAAAMAVDPGLLGMVLRDSGPVTHVPLATDEEFTQAFVPATALAPFSLRRGFSR